VVQALVEIEGPAVWEGLAPQLAVVAAKRPAVGVGVLAAGIGTDVIGHVDHGLMLADRR